jgi:polyvinyl alcohol dehydrogenase (cytochrome)
MRQRYLAIRLQAVTAASLAVVATLAGAAAAPSASAPAADAFVNWPRYQYSVEHGSHNAAATAVTTSNAPTLIKAWTWRPDAPTMSGQPSRQINASPTVVDGRIYIGAKTGVFYALNETTGAVIWKRFLGFQSKLSCNAQGIVSTATVVPDPATGVLTVYVAAPNGIVFALDAATGAVKWQTRVTTPSTTTNDFLLWSSPAVADGHVYMGISSHCDKPLVRAGVVSLDQTTGSILGNYYAVANGAKGGSVWSSVAVDPATGAVFVSTGNPVKGSQQPGDSYSIVRLNPTTMQRVDKFTIPVADQTVDADFGASPVLFTATIGGVSTPMVGACAKNGIYYALRRDNLSAGPVWSRRIGNAGTDPNACIGGSAFDGNLLYQGGNNSTINGQAVNGTIRALNPSTGAVVWERGLPNVVINTPTLNGSGVLAVGEYQFGSTTNNAYLIRASDGTILRTISSGYVFAQAVFADNYWLLPTVSKGLQAFHT